MLVKLADMGICANPAARRNKNFTMIRQYVPEVLNFDSSFTEKVGLSTYTAICLLTSPGLCVPCINGYSFRIFKAGA